ncbi:MAG TPA: RDD family protein, partial [Polyangia bacterium]
APPGGAPPPTSPWGAGSAGAPPPAAPTAPSASWGTPQSGVQGFSLTGTPGVPLPTMDLAVWGTRAIGYLIDGLLVGGAMTVLLVGYTAISAAFGGLLGAADPSGGAASAFMGTWCIMLLAFPVAMLGVGIWDRVYLVSKRGFSIGQGVVKIKVVDVNGALLPQTTALIRLLAQIGLSMVPLGGFLDLLWPLWDPRRQTLHDKAVNCFVINNPGGR